MISKNLNRSYILKPCKGTKSENGVALVMVLGLLTIMVLMAVTFAITMRTERLAAGNNADNVRARELTHVALARAMDDLRAMFHMPDRFVVDGANNRIVLLGPVHDYEERDEVRFFSVGTLPSGLANDKTYTVASKGPDRYTIKLKDSVGVDVNIANEGQFKAGLDINDSYNNGLVSSNRSYLAGTPIKIAGNQYYVVPVDDTQIKLASSYSNAVQGNAATLGVSDTIELVPIHGIYPVMTIQSTDGNQIVYTASRQRLRTGMAVCIEGEPTVYYIRHVKNQINIPILNETNWFAQLCSTYADALANKPLVSLPLAAVPPEIIIPVPSVSPLQPAFASYGTNTVISLSDFSELVTVDSGNDTVNVANRYRHGAAVAFTTTGTLPSPLIPTYPYYVVTNAPGTICLAETPDNALAAIPTIINLTSAGSGTHRIYELGLSGEATNCFPMAVYADAAKALAAATSNGFFEIRTASAELMGKVRYAIVDCSGLLDANYVGDVAGGFSRNDPRAFPVANLPNPPEQASTLPTKRSSYKRYETMPDLANDLSYHPSNLFVYSYSLPEQYDTNMMCLHTPLNIGMIDNIPAEMDKLVSKHLAILNGLCMAGFTPVEAEIVYSNLLDFVDSDSIPTNLDYSVESVPMINEIAVSINIKVTDTAGGPPYNYEIKGAITNECWYPFITVDAGQSFKLCSKVTFTEPNGIKPADLADDSPGLLIAPITAGGFTKNNIRQFVPITISSPTIVDPVVINCTVYLTNTIVDATGDKIVDRLNVPIVLNTINSGSVGSDQPSYTGAECLDPRFNFDPLNPFQWRVVSPGNTLGQINNLTAAHLYGSQPPAPALPTNDCDTAMYVGNRPLRSVAELGYLVYTNVPWKTIKLYGPNRRRVLDVFTISKDLNDRFAHNIYNHGQINPNTKSLDVMKAWFEGMPVDKYQGEGGAATLSDPNAQVVAQNIVNEAGSYTNLSDIGRVFDNTTKFPVGTSEIERESYFRNTCGLFNVHQSVFTILLEAKVASGGNIPKNPAKQRAVVIVWRDPFTGEMFIRHIKWLND